MRTTTKTSVLILTGVLAACSRAPEARQAPVQPTPDEQPGDAVEEVACSGRAGCEVVRRLTVHRDPTGRQQVAAVLRLQEHALTTADHVLLYARWGNEHSCVPWETWLVTSEPHGPSRGQVLARECSMDPSGQPPSLEPLPTGELRSTVVRRVESEPTPHSFLEATEVTDFALDPPHVLRTRCRDCVSVMTILEQGYAQQEAEWDWDAFRGRGCWNREECSPLLPVAAIADDGAFAAGGWKSTRLGVCAMRVDGRSATVRVLSLDEEKMLLEVEDDAFVTRGAVVDAIEVVSDFYEAMPDSPVWTQRLTMDGTFTDHDGTSRRLAFAEDGPNVRRFVVSGVWPPWQRYWWLSYVDTDDGQTIREQLAPVPRMNLHGQAVSTLDPAPRCAVRDHELVPLTGTGSP